MYCGVKYVFIFINTFCVYIFAVYGMTLQHMYKCNEQIRAIRVSIPQAFTFFFCVRSIQIALYLLFEVSTYRPCCRTLGDIICR